MCIALGVTQTGCTPAQVQTVVNDVTTFVQYATGVLSFLESVFPTIAPLLGSNQAAASKQFALADSAAHKALVVATDAANAAEATQAAGGALANLTQIFAPCVDAIAQVESILSTYQTSVTPSTSASVGANISADQVDEIRWSRS